MQMFIGRQEIATYFKYGRSKAQEMHTGSDGAHDSKRNGIPGSVIEQAEPSSLRYVDPVHHQQHFHGVIAESGLINGWDCGVTNEHILVSHIRLCGTIHDSKVIRVYGCQIGRHVHG